MGKMHGYPAGGQYEGMTMQTNGVAGNDTSDEDAADGPLCTQPSPASPSNDSRDESVEDKLARMDQLKETLQKLKQNEMEAKHELENVSQIWTVRVAERKDDLAEQKHHVRMLKRRIKELESRLNNGPPAPGPPCLKFVDEDIFIGVTSLVIIINLSTMTLEAIHPRYVKNLCLLDQFFLLFYLVELVLKAVYYRQQLLCGPVWKVWSNWLDTVVVAVGLVETWIAPAIDDDNDASTAGPSYVNYLRILRLARLLRLVKVFMQSDFAWAEGEFFQSFIMAVIGLNALVMGFEVEMPQYDNLWFYVDQLLLMIFSFELVVRLKRSGCRGFFTSPKDWTWNWLDFIIVMGGVVDEWMLPAYRFVLSLAGFELGEQSSSLGQVMSMLRMARLMRILRLVRLIKDIAPLYKLVVGIAKAMQGMAWVMVLTAMVLYICALVGVKLVGPKGLLWGDVDKQAPPEAATVAFPEIFGAIFNLFKVMNADMSPMEGLFDAKPMSKLVIGFYVVVTNWAIFSILTAVVSEHMARVTQSTEEEQEKAEAQENRNRLVDTIFKRLGFDDDDDVDDDDNIDAEKLWAFLEGDEIAEICADCEITVESVRETVEVLSHRGSRKGCHGASPKKTISKRDFLKDLETEKTSVNQRSIMRLDKRVKAMEQRLDNGLGRLIETVERGIVGRPASVSPMSGI